MSWRIYSFIGLSAVALGACAVDTATPGPAPAKGNAAPAGATEEAQMAALLTPSYRAESVLHSFENADGKAIDCVDFQEEPGVKAMLAEGYTLAQVRQFGELTAEQKEYNRTAAPAPTAFAGDLDARGNARACPDGTVAHERLTKEHVEAVGGASAFQLLRPQKTMPPNLTPLSCPYVDVSDYQWVETGWPSTANQGGSATLSIAQPTITAYTGDHSLSQTWLVGTSGCEVQTVEAGWTVDQGLNGDFSPHVFIYSTASTYGSGGGGTGATGCYNNNSAYGDCVPYVPITSLASIPALPYSVPGGAQHEVAFSTTHVGFPVCFREPVGVGFCYTVYTGWQIAMQIDGAAWQTLGYYQNSAYGTGPLASGSTDFEMGTEAYNTVGNANVTFGSPNVTMGEGNLPTYLIIQPTTKLYGNYSYIRNYSLTPASAVAAEAPNGYVGVGETSEPCSTYGTCVYDFTAANAGAPGSSSWTNWYWYGVNQRFFIRLP